jgi:hypothetical protein
MERGEGIGEDLVGGKQDRAEAGVAGREPDP